MIKMIIFSDGNVTFDYNEEGLRTLTERQKFIEGIFGTVSDEEAIKKVKEKYPDMTEEQILDELSSLFKLAYKEIVPGLLNKFKSGNPEVSIAVATNHTRYVSVYLKGFVDHYFISNEIGFEKNDSRFFEEVIKRTGLNPEEIIYVDYDEEVLSVAQNSGIHTVKVEEKDLRMEEKVEVAQNNYKEANR